MGEFDGRVAIVTGASSGIGRRTAELLAERGARVAIMARSAEKLRTIAGDAMLAVPGDVTNLADVERLFSLTESHFGGKCDVLVNSGSACSP
jgi:2-keto-3-deoxy-L-fuconate dehydrogenase